VQNAESDWFTESYTSKVPLFHKHFHESVENRAGELEVEWSAGISQALG
jgi:hypothetical protein